MSRFPCSRDQWRDRYQPITPTPDNRRLDPRAVRLVIVAIVLGACALALAGVR